MIDPGEIAQLKELMVKKVFLNGDKRWKRITDWQRRGLVQLVWPKVKGSCGVVLSEKGRELVRDPSS